MLQCQGKYPTGRTVKKTNKNQKVQCAQKTIKQFAYKQQWEFYKKNLSKKNNNYYLTDTQLIYFEGPNLHTDCHRPQLLQDLKTFARQMHLKYIFHGKNKSIHPFHVKLNWQLPLQPSATLEHYLEEVKLQIVEITRPNCKLSHKGWKALNALKRNKDLNFKKADKGTTLVVMDENDKIQEGQIQINE